MLDGPLSITRAAYKKAKWTFCLTLLYDLLTISFTIWFNTWASTNLFGSTEMNQPTMSSWLNRMLGYVMINTPFFILIVPGLLVTLWQIYVLTCARFKIKEN